MREAHSAPNLAGRSDSPVEVWRGPQRFDSPVEVRRGPLCSDSCRLRSGEANCDQELTEEVRRGPVEVHIRSNNPDLAGGNKEINHLSAGAWYPPSTVGICFRESQALAPAAGPGT